MAGALRGCAVARGSSALFVVAGVWRSECGQACAEQTRQLNLWDRIPLLSPPGQNRNSIPHFALVAMRFAEVPMRRFVACAFIVGVASLGFVGMRPARS